jgi:Ca2+-binding RTX toxin-like protein
MEAMRRSSRDRLAVIAAFVLVLSCLVTTTAAAAEPTHNFGEKVDYPLVFPVDAPATTGGRTHFWDSRPSGIHHAQDIMADKMTPVFAVADGTVRYVNWSSNPNDLNPDRCCSLSITHDDGWGSVYIHLNNDTEGTDDGEGWGIAPGILPGTHVERGQLIGWVGDSGNAENTMPHLHFELIDYYGTYVDAYPSLVRGQAARGYTCAGKKATHIDTDGDHIVRGTIYDDVIVGTTYADRLIGRRGDDLICGNDGADYLNGGPGSDQLRGGGGRDTLIGGSGPDRLDGGRGNDVLRGKSANDVLNGNAGNDRLYGDGGADTLDGGIGRDTLAGKGGADIIDGGSGNDLLYGGAGNDILDGEAGNDTIAGGKDDDVLFGSAGEDVLDGGDGDDWLYASAEADTYDGGDDIDTLLFLLVEESVHVDLAAGTVSGGATGTVAAIEHVVGSPADDVISGNDGINNIDGADGADTISGGAGNDELYGGAGDDSIFGNDHDDTCDGGDGTDTCDGGDGIDTCIAENLIACEPT